MPIESILIPIPFLLVNLEMIRFPILFFLNEKKWFISVNWLIPILQFIIPSKLELVHVALKFTLSTMEFIQDHVSLVTFAVAELDSWLYWIPKLVIIVIWTVIMQYTNYSLRNTFFHVFNPISLYQWMFTMVKQTISYTIQLILNILERVFNRVKNLVLKVMSLLVSVIGFVWGIYESLLAKPTEICYAHGMIGNVIHLPIVALWVFWPFAFKLNIITGIVSVFLMVKAYTIVQENWCEPVDVNSAPLVTITDLQVIIPNGPEAHGFIMKIKGTKPADLVIKSATLYFDGDEFWHALENVAGKFIINMFKYTFYPIKLCPSILNDADFQEGLTTVETKIEFGTGGPTGKQQPRISRKTLVNKLQELVDKSNNSPLKLRVEYMHKKRAERGVLMKMNVNLADALKS